jgi:HSP20 family protein
MITIAADQTKSGTPAKAAEPQLQAFEPVMEVYESKDGMLIMAKMPGVDETTVHVNLNRGVFTIEGTVQCEVPEGYQLTYTESPVRRYRRSFNMPKEVDADSIDATIQNGILKITLPVSKNALPRKIEVKAAK